MPELVIDAAVPVRPATIDVLPAVVHGANEKLLNGSRRTSVPPAAMCTAEAMTPTEVMRSSPR